jgi:hypothetical protein
MRFKILTTERLKKMSIPAHPKKSAVRFTLLLLISVSVVLSSCGSRRMKLDSRNLIPEKELVPILTDLYLTDGLIAMPRIVMKYAPFDSVSTYYHVIEEHGYTKEAMDRTMKYYFVKDPKELIKIYDKVLSILSERESRVQKEIARTRPKSSSLWPGNDIYSFPDPSGSDSTFFELNMEKQGFFILNATVTLYPDDQSYNPAIMVYSCNADSIDTGRRTYARPFYFIKDGRQHKYRVSFTIPAKGKLHFRGVLYNPENHPGDWDNHLLIQNISITHSPVDL